MKRASKNLRKTCLSTWVLLVWCVMLEVAASAASNPPLNILLLYADDWRHDTLGCAGNAVVKTPNLDRLAAHGIRFERAYVTTSICGVSRASLLTGQWMSRHGTKAFEMFQTPWSRTFPGVLRAGGYWVGHVGKWHNGRFPQDGYDVGLSYSGTHWIKSSDGDPLHVTRKNELDALKFLRTRPRDKPFCLTVAFFAPHAEDGHPDQYLPQPESAAFYEHLQVPVPALATEDAMRRLPPFLQQPANEGRIRWTWRFDSPEKYQRMMKNYYRLCTEIDLVCGRLIEELKSQGQWENTLVIFTTDNGYYHGERLLADKWYPHEQSIRVPLIVWDPRARVSDRGHTRRQIVLNVDLAPTIIRAANQAVPDSVQGRDFSALYLNSPKKLHPAWRDEFFYEHSTITDRNRIPSSQALVRTDWKYVYWPEFQYEELFDLRKDPDELQNLAARQKPPSLLNRARNRFAALRAQAQ